MAAQDWREVDYREYLDYTLQKLVNPGLLLVARGLDGKPPNAMTIGWATFGVVWGRLVCVVLVRPSRYTYRLIEACRDFTVNVPAASMDETVAYCGTVSGRNHDKFAERGLTALPGKTVSSPIIGECLVHYECKVVHHNDIVPANLAPEVAASAYPGGDYHRLYYGEILSTTAHPEMDSLMG